MSAQFVFNPALSFVKPGYKGNLFKNNKFWNEDGIERVSFLTFIKWRFSKNPQKAEKAKDTFRLKIIENPTFCQSDKDMIVWLGHATFFIRVSGISLLLDPVFGDLPFIHRKSVLPCKVADIKNINYLLISHGHRDHLDKISFKQVLAQNPAIEVLAPLKMKKLLHSFGAILKYQEAGWYQQYKTPAGIEIFFLPAMHWHRRGLNDFNQILWGSFLIKTRQTTIYFCGDSAYGEHFKEVRSIAGNIDVCILPIGAYKPAFMMQGSHMNPQEALQAFEDLQGKVLLPMHYGTFDLSDEPLGEPIQMLYEEARKKEVYQKIKDLAVGEEYILSTLPTTMPNS